eukprot:TRINITY_DN277_c2_g1_i2.p1 TRINITY_DN277_c2_g1~~TRINITY_DN277_c2_g1_i2.p1  ORF type:complete len:361 (-),score=87.95 TRINITY_DN277_c2_g1_i2:1419-2501(-)
MMPRLTAAGVVAAGPFMRLAVLLALQYGVSDAFALVPSANTVRLSNRVMRSSTCLRMGADEWRELQPGPGRKLGCLPFTVDDAICIGETRRMHLYEARFLALFETALQKRGGCVGAAIFSGSGLFPIAPLCDIVAWERKPVGVEVTIRCVGRARLYGLDEVDPFVDALAAEIVDDPESASEADVDGSSLEEVSREIYTLHDQCIQLEAKLRLIEQDRLAKIAAATAAVRGTSSRRKKTGSSSSSSSSGSGGSSEDMDMLWGHEGWDDSGFLKPLPQQVQEKYDVLISKPNLGGVDRSSANAPASAALLWSCTSKQAEEVQLLSHVAVSCFPPSARLRGMACGSTKERLEQAAVLLRERAR